MGLYLLIVITFASVITILFILTMRDGYKDFVRKERIKLNKKRTRYISRNKRFTTTNNKPTI